MSIKEKIIANGIKNLSDYGYPDVNNDNILTDIIYASFFKEMLKDNIGKANQQVDNIINELIATIDANIKP